jgi:formylglycine-generating enzyme required for sulfatase activity
MNFLKRRHIILFSTCLIFVTCTSTDKLVKDKKYYLKWNPPGTIKIGNNFYYDQTEISNTDWREYLFWTCKVFGSKSNEYLSALPDTLVWNNIGFNKKNCLYKYIFYYLRHPMFQDYPLVGISKYQARDYSKWRSDRVMEYMLVKNKKFNWDSAPNRDTYFTIERYFTGKYKNVKPDTNFSYYPVYSLPTIDEWREATHYADSVNKIIKRDSIHGYIRSDIKPCSKDSDAPTCPVWAAYTSKKHPSIYNLRGNVGEWTSEYGISAGGSWFDTRQKILTQDTFHINYSNAWTGFRNVCKWRRWSK